MHFGFLTTLSSCQRSASSAALTCTWFWELMVLNCRCHPHSLILKSRTHLIKVRARESSKAALLLLQGHVCDKCQPWHIAEHYSCAINVNNLKGEHKTETEKRLLRTCMFFVRLYIDIHISLYWLWTWHRHRMQIFYFFQPVDVTFKDTQPPHTQWKASWTTSRFTCLAQDRHLALQAR